MVGSKSASLSRYAARKTPEVSFFLTSISASKDYPIHHRRDREQICVLNHPDTAIEARALARLNRSGPHAPASKNAGAE
jgi:hypothetical protein